jgi:hypothetical protein
MYANAPITTQPLPPTPRDFDILQMSHLLHVSTRQIADKHGISQTRVRQIVQRVCNWLAANLPAKTEADQEAEARLARHIAADQLQRQIEQLQNFFEATGDPKYLRQQTRVITSLARLGVIPGAIDALAADSLEGPLTGDEPQEPWSEDNPWANHRSAGHQPLTTDNKPLTTDNCPLPTDNPSVRACSPFRPAHTKNSPAFAPPSAASADAAAVSEQQMVLTPDELKGLQLMERRLLTLLEATAEDDQERRESLENTLATVRQKRASVELRISPHRPGAAL